MESHGLEHTERARVSVRVAEDGSAGPGPAAGSAVRRATALAGGWTSEHPLAESLRPSDAVPTLSQVLAAAAERPGGEWAGGAVLRVGCSGCGAEYGLPPGLTPPWGGRVRCPKCHEVFSVGVRAEADKLVARVAGTDRTGWERACADRSLWAMWGEELLGAYAELRERCGPQVAARAFRRALEDAAPGVPWFAPPTPADPLEPEPAAAAPGGTMFERRQGS